jgi:hypothetical protein
MDRRIIIYVQPDITIKFATINAGGDFNHVDTIDAYSDTMTVVVRTGNNIRTFCGLPFQLVEEL